MSKAGGSVAGAIVGIIGVGAMGGAVAAAVLLITGCTTRTFDLQGHRGARGLAPENTLPAFATALSLGVTTLELDTAITGDGVIVVSHDPVIEGFGLLVEHPFATLRAEVPSVPTLEEAFTALTEELDLLVNVEIKCLPTEPDADPERIVVRAVLEMVERRNLYEKVIVSSFELDAVDVVRALDARVTTAWLTSGLAPATTVPIAAARGHAWLHPDRSTMSGAAAVAAVTDAAANGVRLDVWTVDAPHEIAALAGAGVDAIITNVPDVARSVLG
jgi:glycerophosphoryl diester phosphodiesterase